jgi:hypothetical protein
MSLRANYTDRATGNDYQKQKNNVSGEYRARTVTEIALLYGDGVCFL